MSSEAASIFADGQIDRGVELLDGLLSSESDQEDSSSLESQLSESTSDRSFARASA